MSFDSGVKSYIIGKATVTNYFPINMRGEPDISCKQCKFYRIASRTCGLNHDVIAYPDKFVGSTCPFNFGTKYK